MGVERDRRRWPEGVSDANFPAEAQKWAEQHANDSSGPEVYSDDLPALRELARSTSWKQSLRDLWDLIRRRP